MTSDNRKKTMKKFIKKILKKTPLYNPVLNCWKNHVSVPDSVKQNVLRNYSKRFGLKILVETGTYFGDTIEAMRTDFDQVYSIELNDQLYKKATKRFENVKNVEIIHGDSGSELRNIILKIDQPALFWLDAHYSEGAITSKGEKDTPIFEELECILNAPDLGHIIIIDDARLFGSDLAYPTMDELNQFIKSRKPSMDIFVENDSIRITPGPIQ